jgi:hypothetical protein
MEESSGLGITRDAAHCVEFAQNSGAALLGTRKNSQQCSMHLLLLLSLVQECGKVDPGHFSPYLELLQQTLSRFFKKFKQITMFELMTIIVEGLKQFGLGFGLHQVCSFLQ